MKDDALLEELAKLEHDQWVAWSKDIAKTESITKARAERWKKLWCPYDKLLEDDKDKDREWARKALRIMRKHMEKKACISELLVRIAKMLSSQNPHVHGSEKLPPRTCRKDSILG